MQPLTARILPFHRPAASASAETVAAALLALEGSPLFSPAICIARAVTGVWRVNLTIDGRGRALTPAEARLAARALRDDPGTPGGLEVAARLDAAADQAERAHLRGAA